jgi:acyl carrier protein
MSEKAAAEATAVPEPAQVLAALREALTTVLDPADLAKVDLDAVHLQTPLLSLPVDSLALMEVMTRIEDRFRVYIPEEQAFAFTTPGEIADFVRERVAAKAERRKG